MLDVFLRGKIIDCIICDIRCYTIYCTQQRLILPFRQTNPPFFYSLHCPLQINTRTNDAYTSRVHNVDTCGANVDRAVLYDRSALVRAIHRSFVHMSSIYGTESTPNDKYKSNMQKLIRLYYYTKEMTCK